MPGFDAISFVWISSIHKYRPNRIRGLLVSTSASNNTRLVVAINNISRTVAPGTNEGCDPGTEDGGSGKAENVLAPIQMLPKGNMADSGTGLRTRTGVGPQVGTEEASTSRVHQGGPISANGSQESASHSSAAPSPIPAACS